MEVMERRILPDELTGSASVHYRQAAEVTAVSEVGHYPFSPGDMTQVLMADYTAEVQPKAKAAAA